MSTRTRELVDLKALLADPTQIVERAIYEVWPGGPSIVGEVRTSKVKMGDQLSVGDLLRINGRDAVVLTQGAAMLFAEPMITAGEVQQMIDAAFRKVGEELSNHIASSQDVEWAVNSVGKVIAKTFPEPDSAAGAQEQPR